VPRDPKPPTAPVLPDLRTEEGVGPIEAVVDVVGYVGEADDPEKFVRMHPDRDFQAFMDFPVGDIVHSHPLNPDDPLGKAVVWVRSEKMMHVDVFSENAESVLEAELVGAPMSVWNFLPASRYFAAVLLGLVREPGGPR
jgi:hypothetical protein